MENNKTPPTPPACSVHTTPRVLSAEEIRTVRQLRVDVSHELDARVFRQILDSHEALRAERDAMRKTLDDETEHAATCENPKCNIVYCQRRVRAEIRHETYTEAIRRSERAEALLAEAQAEMQYFVDRVEGRHPDGQIRSRKTYQRFLRVLAKLQPGPTGPADDRKEIRPRDPRGT